MNKSEIVAMIEKLQALLAKARNDDDGEDHAQEAGDPIPATGVAGFPKHTPPEAGEGDILAQIDSLKGRILPRDDDEPKHKFTAAQAKADAIAQCYGDKAPPPLVGESLLQYRRRLVNQFKPHSKTWRDADVGNVSGPVLDTVESQVFADAHAAAHDASTVPAGQLREVTETDQTGRRITRFVGDPSDVWAPFKMPTQRVVSWPSN